MEEVRRAAKAQLRARMRNVRRLLPEQARVSRSAAITTRVIALDAVANARTIVGYHPRRPEVDTTALLQWAARVGKQVGLPRVEGEALVLHRWQPGAPLVEGAFGIREPPADAPLLDASEVDVVLVPALAVDSEGYRVGYGRGYYDRLLPTLPEAVSVAVIYGFQLVVEAPREPGDVPVRFVVTDERTIVAETDSG
jgi:5-formyltetrahydrofolate cyclo-ligase